MVLQIARPAVHNVDMTTLHVVGQEPLTAAVARRLRGLLAELRISQKEFGERTGWGRAYIYRRLSGETPIDTTDLEHIQDTTGIQVLYLISETGPKHEQPLLRPRQQPNIQTHDCWGKPFWPARQLANVA